MRAARTRRRRRRAPLADNLRLRMSLRAGSRGRAQKATGGAGVLLRFAHFLGGSFAVGAYLRAEEPLPRSLRKRAAVTEVGPPAGHYPAAKFARPPFASASPDWEAESGGGRVGVRPANGSLPYRFRRTSMTAVEFERMSNSNSVGDFRWPMWTEGTPRKLRTHAVGMTEL